MAKKSKKKVELPSLVSKILDANDSEDILWLLEELCLETVNSELGKRYDGYAEARDQVVMNMIRDVAQNGDTVEWALSSQFVALWLSGIKNLGSSYINAKGQAATSLRLSHIALETLAKYRNNRKASADQAMPMSING